MMRHPARRLYEDATRRRHQYQDGKSAGRDYMRAYHSDTARAAELAMAQREVDRAADEFIQWYWIGYAEVLETWVDGEGAY